MCKAKTPREANVKTSCTRLAVCVYSYTHCVRVFVCLIPLNVDDVNVSMNQMRTRIE